MHEWSQHLLTNLSSNNISDPLGRNRAHVGEKTRRNWRKTRHKLFSSQNTREWSETYIVSCYKNLRPLQDTNNCLFCLWLLHLRLCQISRMAIVRANPQLWHKNSTSPSNFHYLALGSRVLIQKLIVTSRFTFPVLRRTEIPFTYWLTSILCNIHQDRSIQYPFSHLSFSRASSNIVLNFRLRSPTARLEISWLKLTEGFLFPTACYISWPPHSPWSVHPNSTICRVQTTKFLNYIFYIVMFLSLS